MWKPIILLPALLFGIVSAETFYFYPTTSNHYDYYSKEALEIKKNEETYKKNLLVEVQCGANEICIGNKTLGTLYINGSKVTHDTHSLSGNLSTPTVSQEDTSKTTSSSSPSTDALNKQSLENEVIITFTKNFNIFDAISPRKKFYNNSIIESKIVYFVDNKNIWGLRSNFAYNILKTSDTSTCEMDTIALSIGCLKKVDIMNQSNEIIISFAPGAMQKAPEAMQAVNDSTENKALLLPVWTSVLKMNDITEDGVNLIYLKGEELVGVKVEKGKVRVSLGYEPVKVPFNEKSCVIDYHSLTCVSQKYPLVLSDVSLLEKERTIDDALAPYWWVGMGLASLIFVSLFLNHLRVRRIEKVHDEIHREELSTNILETGSQ